jgi:hypothetical protein
MSAALAFFAVFLLGAMVASWFWHSVVKRTEGWLRSETERATKCYGAGYELGYRHGKSDGKVQLHPCVMLAAVCLALGVTVSDAFLLLLVIGCAVGAFWCLAKACVCAAELLGLVPPPISEDDEEGGES